MYTNTNKRDTNNSKKVGIYIVSTCVCIGKMLMQQIKSSQLLLG